MTSYGRQAQSGASGLGSRRGPPLASIESLLSFEAKSTPRSEFGHHIAGDAVGDYGGGRAEVSGGIAMETVLPVEDFQTLGGDQQSEEIFRLLSLLSPFAGEVSGLKTSIDTALTRISELDGQNAEEEARAGGDCKANEAEDPGLLLLGVFKDPESPHSGSPLLPETQPPDPFITQNLHTLEAHFSQIP